MILYDSLFQSVHLFSVVLPVLEWLPFFLLFFSKNEHTCFSAKKLLDGFLEVSSFFLSVSHVHECTKTSA